MPDVVDIADHDEIERFARRDPSLHLYELGDLDPFFWPHTRWLGLRGDGGELRALTMLYQGQEPPTLLAFGHDDGGAVEELLCHSLDRLPEAFYAHLSPGLDAVLRPRWLLEHGGHHLKMMLTEPAKLDRVVGDDVERLGPGDLSALQDLYERAYPGNWFDARMLQTGQYFGVRDGERIVCVAGVHVYSPRYRVAALGNVTTDPEWRGRGLARRTTAMLCRSLAVSVDTIGLNVAADNAAAIACYRYLGFTQTADYHEWNASAV